MNESNAAQIGTLLPPLPSPARAPAPASPHDWLTPEWTAADLAARRKDSALAVWREAFSAAIRETDWAHPRLAPHAGACDVVRNWKRPADGHGKGLILTGPTGRGKTRSLAALAGNLAQQGIRAHYLKAQDWFARLQNEIAYGRDDARAFVHAFAGVPILMLDDLGQQAVSTARADWSQGWFFAMLDHRVELRLPIFVSTNLTARQLADAQESDVRADPLLRRLLDLADPIKF